MKHHTDKLGVLICAILMFFVFYAVFYVAMKLEDTRESIVQSAINAQYIDVQTAKK